MPIWKCIVKSLILRWIKSNKNYRRYNVNIITVFFMSSYQLYYQFKNFQKFSWILILLSQNVSNSRFHDYQKSTNICVFCKYYYHFSLRKHCSTSGGGFSNTRLTHFAIKNQNSSKIMNIFELKAHLKKCTLDSWNNNYCNFSPIWSNEVLISSLISYFLIKVLKGHFSPF